MPRISLKGKNHTHKIKIRLMTDALVYKRVMEIVRQIDARIAAGKNRTAISANDTKAAGRTEMILLKDGKPNRETVHSVTQGGVCHRPDLWFASGSYCDSCPLFPYCLRDKKRLKHKGSQPADRNAQYFEEKEKSERVFAELVVNRRPRVVVKDNSRIKIKIRK